MSRRHRLAGTGLGIAGVLAVLILSASLAAGEGQVGQNAEISRLQQELNSLRYLVTSRHDSTSLELDNLERENRELRRRLDELQRHVALGDLSDRLDTPTVPVSSDSFASRLISSQHFVLRNDQGEPRALLTLREEGPALVLLDASGEEAAVLVATAEGAELRLRDAAGEMRAIRTP